MSEDVCPKHGTPLKQRINKHTPLWERCDGCFKDFAEVANAVLASPSDEIRKLFSEDAPND